MMDYYLDICIKYISMPSSWKTTQLSFFWRSCITPISHSFRFYQNQSYSFNITPNQFYMLHTFYYYYLYSNFFLNIEVKQCLNERYDRIFFSRKYDCSLVISNSTVCLVYNMNLYNSSKIEMYCICIRNIDYR